MLDLVQMTGYEGRMPHQLSGGQRQRIAIARALINQPDILLLDEPLGALDLKLRKHMQTELSQLQKKTGTTFVYVTHDQDEALNMSDRIAVLSQGRIQQIGTPREIYNNPVNLFVADFIGDRNLLEVEVLATADSYSQVKLGSRIINVRSAAYLEAGQRGMLAVHKDKLRIAAEPGPNSLAGTVLSVHYAGYQIRVEVQIEDAVITAVEYQQSESDYQVGDQVYLSWDDHGAILLPMEAGSA